MLMPFFFRASGWSPAHTHFKVVASFITQIQVHPLSPKICQQIEAETAQVGSFDDAFPPPPLPPPLLEDQLRQRHLFVSFPASDARGAGGLDGRKRGGRTGQGPIVDVALCHIARSRLPAFWLLESGSARRPDRSRSPGGRVLTEGGGRGMGFVLIYMTVALGVCVPKVREEVRLTLLIANRQREGAGGPQVALLLGDLPRELLHAILFDIGSQRQPPAPGWGRIDDGLPDDWRTRTDDTSVPPAP